MLLDSCSNGWSATAAEFTEGAIQMLAITKLCMENSRMAAFIESFSLDNRKSSDVNIFFRAQQSNQAAGPLPRAPAA